MFINRESELNLLEEKYKSDKFELVSIIGRRRIGKTTLVKEFISRKKDCLYFCLHFGYEKDIKIDFTEKVISNFNISFLREPSWRELFEKIFKQANKRMVLVIDEFQRFLKINPGVPSILQDLIDTYKESSKLYLIVVGSSIGMMNSLFDYTSPLYGRRTAQINLMPFDYFNLRKYIKGSEEERINVYSVYGGTPRYLEIYKQYRTKGRDFMDICAETILKKDSFLYNEPTMLLRTELKESDEYFSILKSISYGKCTFKEIADLISVDKNTLSYYLNVLQRDLGLIDRIVPVTEDYKKSKKGKYVIKDNFFVFWFRYVFPNLSMLELDNIEPIIIKIRKELNAYVGRVFEDIIRELIKYVSKKNITVRGFNLPLFSKIGSWWDRKGNEIDICAISYDKQNMLIGEVKWKDRECDISDVNILIEKSSTIKWNGKKIFLFVNKKGFTDEAIKFMKNKGILYLDLNDVEKIYNSIN